MYKIYLDQKDFSRIASGLIGRSGHEEDLKTYKYLLEQVKLGNLRIYYSSMHLEEVTDYFEDGSEWFKSYIIVLKNLTQDNCIISFRDNMKRELRLLISEYYGLKCNIDNMDYPYGIKSEAVLADIPINYCLAGPYSKNQKRNLSEKLKKISKKELSIKFPGSDRMKRSEFINIFTGSYSDPKRIKNIRKYYDILVNIEDYLKTYRNSPVFETLPLMIDSQIGLLLELIADHRKEIESGRATLDEKSIRSLVFNRIIKEEGIILSYIEQICEKNDIDIDECIDKIEKSYQKTLISLECMILIIVEYFNQHKGDRKTDKNDYHDMNHMKFLPYVNYYVCERFFANLSTKIAPNFNTLVFRNLKQLREHLENI